MKDVRSEALLFDFYGNLLKGRQKEIYEASVMDDMSLSEISEEYGISRQAVSAMLMRCRNTLNGYEEKLRLIERFQETEKLAGEIKEIALKSGGSDSKRIAELTDRIIGEL
ncbi:MAG: DNA-binding protein [Lachnospiraceae bacterium]|nr:DNA-binding protein [Lachnospiraceae bacterium]